MNQPMSFASLNLSADLLRALEARGYREPTEIQTATIPAVLRGADVLACAQTGSGKTAAFALPILQLAKPTDARARHVRALVLVPTRDLASQIGESFHAYARYLPRSLRITTVFGGVSINPQMMELRGGADLVIATPGRLLDLVRNNALSIGRVSTLVLDEADKLFELGFAEELQEIMALLPPQRQTLLFSATFPQTVQTLAAAQLREPLRIDIAASATTTPDITQRAIAVDPEHRTQLLRHLIAEHDWTRVLVFVATKYASERVAEKLRRADIAAASFHGELSQGARTDVLVGFKAGNLQVVVATDVAARGIDIARLPVVVNYDLPRSADDYVHRIGRTGRAGASGIAVSFVSPATEAHFRLIEKRHRFRVDRERIAGFEPNASAVPAAPMNDGTGGIKGRRKSKKDKLREAAARAGRS